MLETRISPERYRYLKSVSEEQEESASLPSQPFTLQELQCLTQDYAKEELNSILSWGSSSFLSDLVTILEPQITPERLDFLESLVAKLQEAERPRIEILTKRERNYLEEDFAEMELQSLSESGLNYLALYTITSQEGDLSFEAHIEDDGTCLVLLTPYDKRDGEFTDLDSCLTDIW